MTIEDIAKVCHEANRAYCISIGDHSQKAWEDAAAWQRESASKGVLWRVNNPAASPSAQHEAWVADKIADGWTYGPIKDSAKKEHPCIVPYAVLPAEQRLKDALFVAIVEALRPTLAKCDG